MVRSVLVVFFFGLCSGSIYGQSRSVNTSFYLTLGENEKWMDSLREQDKSLQWKMIRERLLMSIINQDSSQKKCCSPLLVIDGVPLNIPSEITPQNRSEILAFLVEENIQDISILEKEKELLFHHIVSGIIVVSLKDKKTTKRFRKITSPIRK